MTTDRITVAIDAMGGDHAPDQIVAGALATAAELDVAVRLYGRVEDVMAHVPDLADFVGGFPHVLKPEGVSPFRSTS